MISDPRKWISCLCPGGKNRAISINCQVGRTIFPQVAAHIRDDTVIAIHLRRTHGTLRVVNPLDTLQFIAQRVQFCHVSQTAAGGIEHIPRLFN